MMNYKILTLPMELPADWERRLHPSRRDVLLGMHSPNRQMESVAAYLLLCEMTGIVAPELVAEEGGKLYLKDYPELHFNWSHCPVAVACVVGDKPVGIDIERIRPYKPLLAKKVLSAEEHRLVKNSGNPAREFIRFWTKKEALLKLTGEGIRSDLKKVLRTAEKVNFITHETEEYVCTIASYL